MTQEIPDATAIAGTVLVASTERPRATAISLLSQQVQGHAGSIIALQGDVREIRTLLESQQARAVAQTEAAVQAVFDKRLSDLQVMIRAEVASHIGQVTQQIQAALEGGTEEVSRMIQATVALQLKDIQEGHSSEMHRVLAPLLADKAERDAREKQEKTDRDTLELEKRKQAEARDVKVAQVRNIAIGIFSYVVLNWVHNLSGTLITRLPHGDDIFGLASVLIIAWLVFAFRRPLPSGGS